jgi:hypothetical protein
MHLVIWFLKSFFVLLTLWIAVKAEKNIVLNKFQISQ